MFRSGGSRSVRGMPTLDPRDPAGAKTGQTPPGRRSATSPEPPDAWLIIGSTGGATWNPAWLHNLAKDPEATHRLRRRPPGRRAGGERRGVGPGRGLEADRGRGEAVLGLPYEDRSPDRRRPPARAPGRLTGSRLDLPYTRNRPWLSETRLLRGPRRRARRDRRRDQARLPQARPAVAPRRQHGARGAGAVQGDQRGLPGPVRSRSAARRTTCSAGPASAAAGAGGGGVGGFGGFSRHLRRLLRRRRRAARRRRGATAAGRGPALRPPDHVRGGGPRAPRRRSSSRSSAAARPAAAPAPKPGTEPIDLPAVQRPRRGPVGPPDDARPDGQRQRLPALPRRGQDRRDAVRDLPRRRPHRAQADAPGRRSRRASTRATRSGSRTRARSGRAAGRRAACTSRSTSPPHPTLTREGTELYYEADVSIAQAALGTRITVPTVEGEEEVEIKPGTQPGHRDPAARPGRAAPAPAAGRAATSTSSSTSSSRPSSRKRQRELLEAVRGRGRARRSHRSAGHAREAGPRVSDGAGPVRQRPARRPRPRRRGRLAGQLARALGRRRPRGGRGRVARSCRGPRPAGRSVEPAFELVDEGLGGARGPRPGRRIVRAYLPAASTSRPCAPRVARAERDLGHLQAFGLRPIGELEHARRPARPTGRTRGRRTSRSCGSAAGSSSGRRGGATAASRTTSSSRSTRAWRSGPASTRRPGCASPRSSRSRIAAS